MILGKLKFMLMLENRINDDSGAISLFLNLFTGAQKMA